MADKIILGLTILQGIGGIALMVYASRNIYLNYKETKSKK